MVKEFTLALALTIAVPLAMSTAASAEDAMRHDRGEMHKDGKITSHHRGEARRHGMMHAKDRDAHDREEAKVTSELNQRELGGNREMRDH